MSRGIDPTTHRPINDHAPPPPSTINNTISFGAATTSTTHEEEDEEKEEEEGKKSTIINSSSPGSSGGINNNNSKEGIIKSTEVVGVLIRERCPDLNLELRISPPSNYHQQQQPEPPLKTGGRSSGGGGGSGSLCFACSLGIQNSKDCACRDGTTSAINAAGYHDFLGLKGAGVLDYRSLEMK